MQRIKHLLRRAFFRSELARSALGLVRCALRPGSRLRLTHLWSYGDQEHLGPLQRDEALFLFGVLRVIRPRLVVEFGFFHGHSALNFLQALEEGARVVSYDIGEEPARRHRSDFAHCRAHTFIARSQAEFEPADLGGQHADFVFIDAAHRLDLNQETFRRLLPALAPDAIVAVHDTGLWARPFFLPKHHSYAQGRDERWLTPDLYAHQVEEREFVNWIAEEHPEFAQIHFHTTRALRHGLTLLQRQRRLPTVPGEIPPS